MTTQSVVLAFDGKDDFISLPAMNVDYSKGITVETWVFYNSFKNWSRVIDFSNGIGQDNLVFANYGLTNGLAISIRQGGNEQQLVAEGVLETGKWLHIAMVVDAAGNGKLYKNGQEVKSGKIHLPLSINRALNYIAKSPWPNDGYFDGYMTDVRVWNIARSPAEIMKDMVCLGFATGEAGLVGYWPLNDGSGNTASDKSGKGNHGTISGGSTWQQQQLPVQVQISQTQTTTQTTFQVITYLTDKAYLLNGTSDFLQIDSNDAINFGTNENFTISVWVQADAQQKHTRNGDNDIVEKWSSGTPYPYVIRYLNQTTSANGAIVVARYDGKNNPVVTSKARINDGKFHHIVFARTTENGKGKLSLYIDGKLDGTTDDTTTGETKNNSPLFIGQRGGKPGFNFFGGSVKELSFFKSSLTIEQIQQISTGVSITSLIEKWSTTVVTMTPSETIIVGPGGIYRPPVQEPTPIVGPDGIYRPPVQEPTPIVGPGGIYRPPTGNQPVAYYPLNGNAYDAGGNNAHGAEKGKISYAAGRIEQAAVFDGGSYIEVDDPFKDTTQFTIALWLKPTAMNDGGYHGFIGKQGDTYRKPGMWVSPANSGLHYDSYSTTGQRFDCLLNNFFEAKDRWVHVVWVKQGTEYRIYRNGELFATKPAPENFYTAKSSYWIGRVDNFFVGQIDDVRIYNVPLSVDEIKALINSNLNMGLIAHYPSEGNANDVSGNNLHGTVHGATLAVDRFGNPNCAYNFNGKGDKIIVNENPLLNLGTGNFAIMAWIKTSQTGIWKRIVTKRAGNNPNWYSLAVLNGKAVFEIYPSGNLFSTSNVNDGNWHFVCVVRGSQTFSMYIDGALQSTMPDTGLNLNSPGSNLEIGIWANESYDTGTFTGNIDDIRIYNRALSAEEVKQIHQLISKIVLPTPIVGPGGIYRPPTGNQPVAYYPLNGNAQDASGNNAHGAEKGKISYAAGRIEQAAVFDGGSYIEIDDPFKNTTEFTIALWLKPTVMNDGGFHGFIGKQGDAYRKPGMWVCPSKNGLHYDSYSPTGQRFYGLLDNFFEAKDVWVHVTWVKQGTEYRIYRNGELFTTQPAPENFYTAKSSYWIGRIDNFFVGQMDDVRIYNVPLSAGEIKGIIGNGLDAGLIAYYPLNGNANDMSGNNLHGKVYGATLAVDRFGNPDSAYQFDGVDDYIEVAHNALLDLPESASISLWIKQTDDKNGRGARLIDKITAGAADGYLIDTYDGKTGRNIRVIAGISGANAKTVYSLNEWHHIVVTIDKGNVITYVNGNVDGTSSHSTPNKANQLSLLIGAAHGAAEFFKGYMDDIRIYKRVLSAAEVKQLYQITGKGLIAVYEGKKSAINVGTTYLIRSKLHGFVLDIEGSNRTAGARVISYPINGTTGTPNQHWRFVPVPGSKGTYLISSVLNNFVIDITGSNTAPVTPIIAYPTNGQNGTPNQQWELIPVPNTENTFLIKTKLNGFVLDVEGSNKAAGTRVISYPVNGATGTPNQHWEFVVV